MLALDIKCTLIAVISYCQLSSHFESYAGCFIDLFGKHQDYDVSKDRLFWNTLERGIYMVSLLCFYYYLFNSIKDIVSYSKSSF